MIIEKLTSQNMPIHPPPPVCIFLQSSNRNKDITTVRSVIRVDKKSSKQSSELYGWVGVS